jgi:hypothetical protein
MRTQIKRPKSSAANRIHRSYVRYVLTVHDSETPVLSRVPNRQLERPTV